MKTGINMTSVNKIKELAEAKEFWEALDLVEEQDLEKSYNPQFLRLCGEIYLENGRYEESRKVLLRAHIMAPEGNRIIYELVRLYLHMGYFTRAERYFEQYEANAMPNDIGIVHLRYLIGKARHKDIKELLAILLPVSDEETEEKWIFETALLYALVGRIDKSIEECDRIIELYKNTRYSQLAIDLKENRFDVQASYYRFPLVEKLEPEEQDELVKKEEEQLVKDYDRLHPKDPIIISMEDEDEEETPKAKPNKKFRLFKKSVKESTEEDITDEKDKQDIENNVQEQLSNEETLVEEKEDIVEDITSDLDEAQLDIIKENENENEEIDSAEDNEPVVEDNIIEDSEPVVEDNIIEDSEPVVEDNIVQDNEHIIEDDITKKEEIPNDVEALHEEQSIDIEGDLEKIDTIENSSIIDEDKSVKEKLVKLVSLSKEENMELPSYEDISITSGDELAKKYKDREIGADGIDETMMDELPETSILLKKLMDNQKHIAKELEEKQMYGVPLTDEYIEQLERELEEELNNLAPLLEEKLNSIVDNSKEDDVEDSINEENIEETIDDSKDEDTVDIDIRHEDIELENENVLNEATVEPIILDDDLFEELQVSDEIDSTDIVELYDLDEVLKENLKKEEELQRKAEDILISLGIMDVSKFDANDIKQANNEIISKYSNTFERDNFKQYLVIDDNKKQLLSLLKERR